MKDFKGFDDWIEIFRGGKQTDSKGRTHDGDALIDKAVNNFDAKHHEPPIVVGHPKDNAPAFGWVDGLKKAADKGVNVLLAKFKQVVPEFEGLAKKGLYKKRSASFYPDGRLRHVGFLGAAPPAIKGLAEMNFSDDEADTFEFYDPGMSSVARIFRSLRDWLIEKEGKEAADSIIPDWDVEYMREQASKEDEVEPVGQFSRLAGKPTKGKEDAMTFKDFMEVFKFWKQVKDDPDLEMPPAKPAKPANGQTNFTEADIEAAKNEAADAERKKVEAEFAEKGRTAKHKARKQEISTWCDEMVEDGKMTPALVKFGVPEILSFLAASGDEIEFGEEKEKALPYDRFKALFETELPKLIDFSEIAARDTDIAGTGSAGEKMEALIRQRMKENKDLGYSAAFSEVQQENPALAAEYLAEFAQSA